MEIIRMFVITLALLLVHVEDVVCSWGDSSTEYLSCKHKCISTNCTRESELIDWQSRQPITEYLVGWSCHEDCGYECMWISTEIIYSKYSKVPQYHGRWPFVRILGMQEPASVIFSVMNLVANVYMINWFVKVVPPSAPMYGIWVLNAVIAINAWFWSSIFHTRDTYFTEMMDYFCAFSTVLFSLLAFVFRTLVNSHEGIPKILIFFGFIMFYVTHVYSMVSVKFDYGYNMKVNVLVGGLNCLCWLVWFYKNKHNGGHIQKGAWAVVALTISVTLELLEFTPILWSIDSHALWHLVTSPLPILWYSFAAEDCLVLMKENIAPYKKTI